MNVAVFIFILVVIIAFQIKVFIWYAYMKIKKKEILLEIKHSSPLVVTLRISWLLGFLAFEELSYGLPSLFPSELDP